MAQSATCQETDADTGKLSHGAAFKIRSFRKRYPHYELAIDVLDIPHGVVALVGESGSGKSTLLNALGLLDPIFEGSIQYRGEDLAACRDPDRKRRTYFSFAFQTTNLIVNLSGATNIALSRYLGSGLYPADRSTKELVTSLFSDMSASQIDDLVSRYTSDLSVGQRHRIAVVRALQKAVDGATVLFADEPTANVDRRTADECFARLRNWQRSSRDKRVLLLATHDLILAQRADYIILLGAKSSASLDGTVHVQVKAKGPIKDCWAAVEGALVRRDDYTPASVRTPAHNSTSEKFRKYSVLAFLFAYCWSDTTRRRELFPSLLRTAVVSLMFLSVFLALAIVQGVTEIQQVVLRGDRLLRLVELDSLGAFPIRAEKMRDILGAVETHLQKTRDMAPAPRVAGISPKRLIPIHLYRADGTLNSTWTGGVRVVFENHPDLDTPDQLFTFWGIEPIGDEMSVLVSERLLNKLGYSPDDVRAEVAMNTGRFLMFADERGHKIRLPVAGVREFPDEEIDMLVPALLVNHIESLSPEVIVPRYRIARLGVFDDRQAAESLLSDITHLVTQVSAANDLPFDETCCRIGFLQAKRTVVVATVAGDDRGLDTPEWEMLRSTLNTALAMELPIVLTAQVAGPGDIVVHPISADATMATLFVQDHTDVPAVFDFIREKRSEYMVRIVNGENEEFIRTTQNITWILNIAIVAAASLFLFVCLVGLAYSFVARIQTKLPEIGILRAFGARPRLVMARFVLEILGICVFACLLAEMLSSVLLRTTDQWLRESFRALLSEGVPAFNRTPFHLPNLNAALGLTLGTVSVVLVLTWYHLKKSPAELLARGT